MVRAAKDTDHILGELVDRLVKAFDSALHSVILYGSAAGGDVQAGFSDLNVLCVLAEVTPRELDRANTIIRWWRAFGNPSPLLLSAEEVRNSSDCFPIEFHDLAERRRVLHGQDVLAGLAIDDSFYRAQVEHELRAKLFRLRQRAAGLLDDSHQLRVLLADSLSTFCVLFRHALRLNGVEATHEKRVVIRQACQHFGFNPAPFEAILDFREEKIKPRELNPASVLADYLRQVEVVVAAVDRLAK